MQEQKKKEKEKSVRGEMHNGTADSAVHGEISPMSRPMLHNAVEWNVVRAGLCALVHRVCSTKHTHGTTVCAFQKGDPYWKAKKGTHCILRVGSIVIRQDHPIEDSTKQSSHAGKGSTIIHKRGKAQGK